MRVFDLVQVLRDVVFRQEFMFAKSGTTDQDLGPIEIARHEVKR